MMILDERMITCQTILNKDADRADTVHADNSKFVYGCFLHRLAAPLACGAPEKSRFIRALSPPLPQTVCLLADVYRGQTACRGIACDGDTDK
jgi:hypothetical protein